MIIVFNGVIANLAGKCLGKVLDKHDEFYCIRNFYRGIEWIYQNNIQLYSKILQKKLIDLRPCKRIGMSFQLTISSIATTFINYFTNIKCIFKSLEINKLGEYFSQILSHWLRYSVSLAESQLKTEHELNTSGRQ